MEEGPAFGIEDDAGVGVHFGGTAGGDEFLERDDFSFGKGVAQVGDTGRIDEGGAAAVEGVFGFKAAGESFGEPEGVIDEASLDAGVEGELVCGFMDGFGVVDVADCIGDLEVDPGDGLAGAVAFDGEGVDEAGLALGAGRGRSGR